MNVRFGYVQLFCLLAALATTLSCSPPPQILAELPQEVVEESAPTQQLPVTPALQAFVERNGVCEYVLGPGDVLNLTLRDVEVTSERVTVRPDGNISFALAEDVRAAGITVGELDAALTAELGHFLRRPRVDVEVVEYKSKLVSVLGAVQTVITSGTKTGQGRYPLRGKTTVLDLILEAGGTTPDAQLSQVQLVRAGESYQLDLQRVLTTGDPANNPVLQGNDIIIVPGAANLTKKVIVLGEVKAPDVYLFADDARLMEALSKAGGVTSSALRDDIRLIRADADGPRMYTIDFARLISQGDLEQNLFLRNNDIIYVPRSFMGDVNAVIAKVEPLLDLMLLPATYRDLYTTGGGLRLDTGKPAASDQGTVFTRALPGTAKPVPAASPEQEDKGAKKEE